MHGAVDRLHLCVCEERQFEMRLGLIADPKALPGLPTFLATAPSFSLALHLIDAFVYRSQGASGDSCHRNGSVRKIAGGKTHVDLYEAARALQHPPGARRNLNFS